MKPAALGDAKALLCDRIGRERAITARALASKVAIPEREVRALIQELVVVDGWGEIMASVGDPPGYYWASCLAEAELYMRTLRARAIETLRRRRAVRLAMQRLPTARPIQPRLL